MRVNRSVIAILAGLAAVFIATPAEAAVDTRPKVQVQVASNVSVTAYDIDYAIGYLNARTTRTRLVRGKCVVASRCIVVKFAMLGNPKWYGFGVPPNSTKAGYIHLATASTKATAPVRRRLFLHELGHTRNLVHGTTCASVMSTWLYCNGRLVPYAFAPAESALLRKQ